jgi:hypothetical protein
LCQNNSPKSLICINSFSGKPDEELQQIVMSITSPHKMAATAQEKPSENGDPKRIKKDTLKTSLMTIYQSRISIMLRNRWV